MKIYGFLTLKSYKKLNKICYHIFKWIVTRYS